MIDLVVAPASDYPRFDSSNKVAPSLVNIRKRFCELSLDRILSFESLKSAIEANHQPKQALDEIANLAHKIAGVAATLGYPTIGLLAAEIELEVRKGTLNSNATDQTWTSVQPILEALLDELEGLLS